MKKLSDIQATILNAIVTNTKVKVVLAMPDPDDAAYLQRVLFTGFIDYSEWKPGTDRPVAVGNDKVIVRGTSDSTQYAEHDMVAHTRSRGRGQVHGTVTVEGQASAVGTGSGESAGQVFGPPLTFLGPNAPGASSPQVIIAESIGSNSSRSDVQQTSRAHGVTDAVIETEGEADTVAHGTTRGRSRTDSENETFLTRYALLPSQLYSATEQAERLTGEIMNLAFRECFVKVDNQRPIRTRTADLPPSFRSAYSRRLVMAAFEKTLARSPYLLPAAEVDAQIAGRTLLPAPPPKPEADFTAPTPLPIIDTPLQFARNFLERTVTADAPPKPKPKPKPKKPKGRRPVGDLGPQHDRFRVIDGDVDKQK